MRKTLHPLSLVFTWLSVCKTNSYVPYNPGQQQQYGRPQADRQHALLGMQPYSQTVGAISPAPYYPMFPPPSSLYSSAFPRGVLYPPVAIPGDSIQMSPYEWMRNSFSDVPRESVPRSTSGGFYGILITIFILALLVCMSSMMCTVITSQNMGSPMRAPKPNQPFGAFQGPPRNPNNAYSWLPGKSNQEQ